MQDVCGKLNAIRGLASQLRLTKTTAVCCNPLMSCRHNFAKHFFFQNLAQNGSLVGQSGGDLLLRSSHLRASWVSRCFRPSLLSLLWGAVAVARTGAGVGTLWPVPWKA